MQHIVGSAEFRTNPRLYPLICLSIAPVPVHCFSITFIAVHVTCKNEEDPIKNEGARALTTLYTDFSDAQG